MQPFRVHDGLVAPLPRAGVDTDQIIPKQFLKRIERSGFGDFLFYDWRFLPGGAPDPAFVLNQRRYRGASILIAGRNFGCGSSREHAPWALADFGFRALIAPSFADIFLSNCAKNGLLTVTLREDAVEDLLARAAAQPGYRLTVDLEQRLVRDRDGFCSAFDIDPFRRFCLLEGLDDIGLTLRYETQIAAYESRQAPLPRRPHP